MDNEDQFCVNCVHVKIKRNWLWLFLPIFGWYIASKTKSATEYLCKKSGYIDKITGNRSVLDSCEGKRQYSKNCSDFCPKSTPLRDVPDRWLTDEIRKRGLFKLMQNHKKESDDSQ